jgi:hypothetical protein
MTSNTIVKLIPLEGSWRKANSLREIQHESLSGLFFNGREPQTISPVDFPPIDIIHCSNIVLLSHAKGYRRINLICDSSVVPIEIAKVNLDYVISIYTRVKQDAIADDLPIVPTSRHMIKGKCVLLAGWGPHSWGHFIAEYLPRMMLLRKYFQINGVLPIYVSEGTPDYILKAMSQVLHDYSPKFMLFSDNTLTFFEQAIVPPIINMGGKQGYHPFLSHALDEWISGVATYSSSNDRAEKVYISRQHNNYLPTTLARDIVNETELIEVLAANNFRIVAMEELDLIQKINLLSSSRLVLGAWGSGLLNTMLTVSRPSVISLGIAFNASQYHVCDITHQPYYEIPTLNPANRAEKLWKIEGQSQYVDVDLIQSAVEHALKRRPSVMSWQ